MNAAAKCLKASVSGPPPATAKSCLSKSIEQWVLPAPEAPLEKEVKIYCRMSSINESTVLVDAHDHT